jgi:hypothetical protein
VASIIDASLQRPGLHATYKYAFSFDNGKTWTEKFIPNINLPTGTGFPVTGDGQVWTNTFDGDVAIDRSGNAYLASCYSRATVDDANGIYVCVASLGRGDLNFTAAHTYSIVRYLDPHTSTGTGEAWIAVDNSSSPHSGTIYATWLYQHPPGTMSDTRIMFSRSTDQGQTWSAPLQISLPGHGEFVDGPPQIVVGPAGEIYVVYRDVHGQNNDQLFLAKSTDGGLSFSSPAAITPTYNDLSFPATYTGAASNAALAVSPSNGNVYVVYPDQPDGLSSQVEFIRSTDGGASFSASVVINDTFTGQHFEPAVTVDDTGVLHASWYDTRNSPTDPTRLDIYASYSLDNGATFSPNAKVTLPSSPTTPGVNVGTAIFFGDYTGIAAAAGYAHPVWTSGGVNADGSGQGMLQTATLTIPVRTSALTTTQARAAINTTITMNASSYTITDLGTLGGTNSSAFGVNNAGQVVGSSTTARGDTHAVSNTAQGSASVSGGGGIFIATVATVYLDAFTVAHTINNIAPIDPDIDATYILQTCP